MNNYIYMFFVAMMLCAVTTSYAQTADGETPALETGCDSESGAAFGLCNAFCEAMDCDSDQPQASDQACERVLDRFYQITGSDIPPCNSLPQANESCDRFQDEILFGVNDPELYGCYGGEQALFCNPSLRWVCEYTGGG